MADWFLFGLLCLVWVGMVYWVTRKVFEVVEEKT